MSNGCSKENQNNVAETLTNKIINILAKNCKKKQIEL